MVTPISVEVPHAERLSFPGLSLLLFSSLDFAAECIPSFVEFYCNLDPHCIVVLFNVPVVTLLTILFLGRSRGSLDHERLLSKLRFFSFFSTVVTCVWILVVFIFVSLVALFVSFYSDFPLIPAQPPSVSS